MNNYKCERCHYMTPNRNKFKRHLGRKHVCKPLFSDISIHEIYSKYFNDFNKNDKNVMIENQDNTLKKPPKNLQKTPKKGQNLNICEHCSRSFTRKDNLTRHYNRCKIKKDKNQINLLKRTLKEKDMLINEMQIRHEKDKKNMLKKMHEEVSKERAKILKLTNKQIEKASKIKEKEINNIKRTLKKDFFKELEKMKQTDIIQKSNKSLNIDTVNNTNNNYIMVKLNSFSNTDYSHIKDEDYLECIRRGNMGIPFLIQKIHFNPEKPENHNIFISNIKSDYIKVYENGKWMTRLQYEAINMMVQDNANIVEDKIEEWHDKGHKYSKDEYKITLDKYPRFLNRLNDSKYVGRKVEQEVKLVLFNNKDMVIEHM